MRQHDHLHALFEPSQVAVIGASAVEGKIGHTLVKNLLDAGFAGDIFPVNPKGGEVLGLPVTSDITQLPKPLDLAVISVPPQHVLPALESLAKLPVKAVIVITAGFKEMGREGYYLEEKLRLLAEENNIALLGPNCLGLINTSNGLNASFAKNQPPRGGIAFFSQSGALCVSILDYALGNNMGFSQFISLGNKAVLDESEMLAYLAEDRDTKVILGYVESIEHGQRFLETAREVARTKPIVLIKSGTTAAGAKAASSHTGAIAGADQAYTAAFKQAGILRVHDLASLFHLAKAFSTQPLPKGPNLAIITNSGGPGIMAADTCENSGLLLAKISASTAERLREFLPPYASLYNPIDIIGDANAERYAKTLKVVAQDERVHAILVMLSPTASAEVEKTAAAMIEVAKGLDKPLFGCFMGDMATSPGTRMLSEAGIPCYPFPEPAIRSIEAMFHYAERSTRPSPVDACPMRDREAARKVIEEARAAGQEEVVEFQAQNLVKAYGLPLPRTTLARTSDEAAAAADEIGYPVVLKIASPEISHKSDVGGVRVNLKTSAEVRQAFLDITSRTMRTMKNAFITGCLVQEMAPKGSKEIIVGVKRDPQFGPMIMFGLGGIYVEVLKDISFRLAPLSVTDAMEMIREIRSFPLLRGVRGEEAVDFQTLSHVLQIMSQLALDFPDIEEAEFNPVLVSEHGAMVADVRLILSATDEDIDKE